MCISQCLRLYTATWHQVENAPRHHTRISLPVLYLLPVPAQELGPDANVHAGPNPFTMGVDQPNKRAADQAGKKGKPARKAGANIQSTPGASMPAHATAPINSSSSSSLPLQVMPHVFICHTCSMLCVLVVSASVFCQPISPNLVR